MSQVRLNQRRTSSIQYVDTARELAVHTIQYGRKFPKSAMFLIVKDIVDSARKVYTEVVIANSCYPKSLDDVAFRATHLREAKGNLEALDGLLSMAKVIFQADISDYGWLHWGDLINKEMSLIKGVMTSDAKLTFD